MTTWKRIPGFMRYVASSDGEIATWDPKWEDPIGTTPPRILAVRTNHGGYIEIKITGDDGRRVWRKVHALVLEAFVGPRPSARHHGAHADRNRANNRLSNLAWKTPEENEADKAAHGTKTGGTGAPRVSRRRVSAILHRASLGESLTQIGRRFGLHRSSVARIVAREVSS